MNGPVGVLVRRALRAGRRGLLGLAIVIAVAGAVSMTSLMGARRTASAFPRYLEASHASDVSINVISTQDGQDDRGPIAAITAQAPELPGVASTATYVGLEGMFVLDPDDPEQPNAVQPEVLGSLDGRFLEQDAAAVDEGRLPQASKAEEVFVNRRAATSLHLVVGSPVTLAAVIGLDADGGGEPEIVGTIDAHVVGIGQFPDEVLGDDIDGSERLLTTPAVAEQYGGQVGTYTWQGLRLDPGTSVDATISAYRSLLDDTHEINVQRTDVQRDRVQRAVRPVVVGLTAFGIAAGVAALALGALGIVRLVAASRADLRTLRALGLSTRQTATVIAGPAMLAVVLGAGGAATTTVLLSPLTPVGAVRSVEPDPGLDLDPLVVVAGAVALIVLLGLAVALIARRAVRSQRVGDAVPTRPSRIVEWAAAAGLGPAPVVGVRHALGGGGRDGVPTRSTLAACAISVVAMVSALTFGASVAHLIDAPSDYGWAADLAVNSGGGYDQLDPAKADVAAASKDVAGLTLAGFGPLQVGGARINAIGIQPVEGPALITVVSGRLPTAPDEVALGATTARDLHASAGTTIDADGGPLDVVGIAALPAIGPLASVHPSLGQGAVLTLDGLTAQSEQAYASVALVRLTDGTEPDVVADRVRTDIATAMSESPPDFASSYGLLRPAEVLGLQPARRTAYLLAGLLGGAALLALGLTLTSSVRRRRATFATLSGIGFGRRDLRRAVRWQTNVTTLLALAIGIPLGIVVGRASWSALATELGVASGAQVPVALLLAAAAVLLVANLIGERPARRAARGARLQPRTD